MERSTLRYRQHIAMPKTKSSTVTWFPAVHMHVFLVNDLFVCASLSGSPRWCRIGPTSWILHGRVGLIGVGACVFLKQFAKLERQSQHPDITPASDIRNTSVLSSTRPTSHFHIPLMNGWDSLPELSPGTWLLAPTRRSTCLQLAGCLDMPPWQNSAGGTANGCLTTWEVQVGVT